MKQAPDWSDTQERMRPGRLTRDGMLGNDARSLGEIIDGDAATLDRLGVSRNDIAGRLRGISMRARDALGTPVEIGPEFEAWMDEGMGRIPCPFGHPGRLAKGATYLRHRPTGRVLQWSDLGVHMIEEHGFFGGKGSAFRLEPEEIVRLSEIESQTRPQ